MRFYCVSAIEHDGPVLLAVCSDENRAREIAIGLGEMHKVEAWEDGLFMSNSETWFVPREPEAEVPLSKLTGNK